MKKLFFLLPLFLILINAITTKADQLAWLDKSQLNQAMDYINKNDIKEVILFCGCCDKDIKEKILVSKIYYRQVKDSKEYYEIVIEGTTLETKPVKKAVDLAYVHIKKNDKAVCLGVEMGFTCDPCTKPFDWF